MIVVVVVIVIVTKKTRGLEAPLSDGARERRNPRAHIDDAKARVFGEESVDVVRFEQKGGVPHLDVQRGAGHRDQLARAG